MRVVKTGKKCAFLVLLAALCVGAAPFGSLKARAEGALQETEKSYDVNRLQLPEDAQRLVVVEAEGLQARVSLYGKDLPVQEGAEAAAPGEWSLICETGEGLIGRGGMGKVWEGDEKTPAGLYKMNTPFGTSPKLEGFPDNYLQVDGRYYWNGDSESDRYNKLVNTDEYTDFNRSKSEHLSTYGGIAYNYCIDTGYNPEGTPYKGSALFLHCSAGKNTAGCIAIPEAAMVEIMKGYVEGKTYILLESKGNFAAYEKTEEAQYAPEVQESETGNAAETAASAPAEADMKKGPCILTGSCA